MTNQIIPLNRCPDPAVLRKQQLRRTYAQLAFLVEAAATLGIMVTFLACAVVFLCLV